MTYIRRLVRGDNVYLYEVTSYRDKETGKVRQRSEYKGKEIIKDNIATLRKPRNRITARKVLDSAPYIIYRFAEDFGIQDSFIPAIGMIVMAVSREIVTGSKISYCTEIVYNA